MNHQTRARVMTVVAMMTVATTEARDRWADGEEAGENMVMVMITEGTMAVGTIMGRGKEKRLGHGVQMLTKNYQK